MTETSAPPIFVMCAARTGSTLLRTLLDAHKEIAGPPETHVARVCEALERTWRVVTLEAGIGELPPGRLAGIRRVAAEPLDGYARARGKPRWCDKSLDNVWLAPLLARVFPDAPFICLVRHCLDFVISGLEASPWGFGAYGMENYVRASPGNLVGALVRYWCDHTEALLDVLEAYPGRAFQVRYEDMVTDTDAVLAGVLRHVGVAAQDGLATAAFSGVHDLGGGDHKLPFTEGVHPASIGTGRRVPYDTVPADLRDRMNDALRRCGYAPVTEGWNLPDHPAGPAPAGTLDALLGVRLPPCDHSAPDRMSLLVEDLGAHCTVDVDTATAYACDGTCAGAGRMAAGSVVLAAVVRDETNLGTALRTGRVRARGSMVMVAGVVEALRGAVREAATCP